MHELTKAFLVAFLAASGVQAQETLPQEPPQAEPTVMIEVGRAAPPLKLLNLRGAEHSLQYHLEKGRIVVLHFFDPARIDWKRVAAIEAQRQALPRQERTVPEKRDVFERVKTCAALHGASDGVQWLAVATPLAASQDLTLKDLARRFPGDHDWVSLSREEKVTRLKRLEAAYDIDQVLLDEEGKFALVARPAHRLVVVAKSGLVVYDAAGDALVARAEGTPDHDTLEEALRAVIRGEAVPSPHGASSLPASAPREEKPKELDEKQDMDPIPQPDE